MHFLLLGASGRSGKLVIEEALERGHTITALVRNTSSLPVKKGVTIVQGTPLQKEDITKAFKATPSPPTAVLTTLSSVRTSDSPFAAPVSPPRMMADANSNVIAVMKQYGVHKIVIMQAFGTGDSLKNLFWPMQILMKHSGMNRSMQDHDITDKEVKESGVTFVMARPAMLNDGEKMPLKFWGNTGRGSGMIPSVSRKSVAAFLLDALEKDTWDGTTPVVSN
ncbi:hypothetical protein BP5796_01121 [Coleophoma crateriformis]|uniref:NAD(P)-binding domain-containing protein n=1 Tax=Coleophoma crateriformis TaxID=565419 RepID=A0A3D8TCR0_9HELO|nr:hypothetical protein BP5796_01121 [Coleophoma crateriformis]